MNMNIMMMTYTNMNIMKISYVVINYFMSHCTYDVI